MNQTPSNCCGSCPTADELRELLAGGLSDVRQQECVAHLDECCGCQQAIQQTATGDSTFPEIVEHIDQHQPAKQSAYWSAVKVVERELATTFVPNMQRDLSKLKLDFLGPPSDPAYLGRLDHFDIARVIGRGGMGIVLEGFDSHLRRSVAIKVLDPQLQENDVARQRFCREARAAASIAHEHVVAMHHVAKSDGDGVPYLVMQLIQGESLEARIAKEGRLPVKDVLRIGMQTAAGLAAAHAQNLVHRDIKPGNILLEAPAGRVKLTDFGLARMAEDIKLTQTGFVAGTPMYMAPEQALGEQPDERADFFSLGAVLYEMATGRPPFSAPTILGVLKKIADEAPIPIRQLSPEFPEAAAMLIEQMLAKRPADRPVSAAALAEAFAVLLTGFGPLSPLQVPAVAEEAACEAVQAALSKSGQSVCYRKRTLMRILYSTIGAVAGIALTLAIAIPLLRQPPNADRSHVRQNVGDSELNPHSGERGYAPTAVLSGNAGPVWAVAFTPDGETLAMAIDDGTVKLWNVADKRVRSTIKAHPGPVWGMSISHDGRFLATGGDDSKVRIFDLVTTNEERAFETKYAIRTLAFSHTTDDLLVGGRTGQVEIWNAETGERTTATAGHAGMVTAVAFSPDGRTIASVSGDKTAKLWNAATGGEQLSLQGHSGGIYGVAFSPDGSKIVTGGWDKTARLWDTASGSLEHTCEAHDGDIWAVAFSPSTPYGASVGEDRIVRVFHTEQKAEIAGLKAHTGTLYAVAFSRDGRWLASAGRDGTARVWDMREVAKPSSEK
ncbi:MAG: serine/threonine protein kinase [Planctomycetaceae bacterium]|nr:serine/threonine protein kinase [Planctomycetaceae bacterium]